MAGGFPIPWWGVTIGRHRVRGDRRNVLSTDQIDPGTTVGVADGPGKGRSLAALDGLNFFLADVQSGLAPFLGIYLLTVPGWNPGGIGLVLTIGGIVGLLVQTPAGALIDRTTHKRTLIVVAALATSAGAYLITINPCLLYTSPSPRDGLLSRMPSSA